MDKLKPQDIYEFVKRWDSIDDRFGYFQPTTKYTFKIAQMSDCGSYENTIIEMKRIASNGK